MPYLIQIGNISPFFFSKEKDYLFDTTWWLHSTLTIDMTFNISNFALYLALKSLRWGSAKIIYTWGYLALVSVVIVIVPSPEPLKSIDRLAVVRAVNNLVWCRRLSNYLLIHMKCFREEKVDLKAGTIEYQLVQEYKVQ